MITNDATLLKVKHEVLYEVAKLAYEGRLDDERTIFHIRWFPVHSHFSDVVYTERGRLSDRGSDLPRAKPLEQRMMGM